MGHLTVIYYIMYLLVRTFAENAYFIFSIHMTEIWTSWWSHRCLTITLGKSFAFTITTQYSIVDDNNLRQSDLTDAFDDWLNTPTRAWDKRMRKELHLYYRYYILFKWTLFVRNVIYFSLFDDNVFSSTVNPIIYTDKSK